MRFIKRTFAKLGKSQIIHHTFRIFIGTFPWKEFLLLAPSHFCDRHECNWRTTLIPTVHLGKAKFKMDCINFSAGRAFLNVEFKSYLTLVQQIKSNFKGSWSSKRYHLFSNLSVPILVKLISTLLSSTNCPTENIGSMWLKHDVSFKLFY